MPKDDFEVIYEIRIKGNDMSFINDISSIEGVKSAIMLSYDGTLQPNRRVNINYKRRIILANTMTANLDGGLFHL